MIRKLEAKRLIAVLEVLWALPLFAESALVRKLISSGEVRTARAGLEMVCAGQFRFVMKRGCI